MEVWYTLTGGIDPNQAQSAIGWINSQVYNGAVKLKFLISSNGGDTDSAIRLYDYLKSLPIEVETIGFGQIDSAANLVFLAGRKRLAVKECRFLLHEGTFNIGQPNAPLHIHEEVIDFFRELTRRHISILTTETGKSPKEIQKVLKSTKIFTTEEAKNFGLVHDIIEKLPLISQQRPAQPPR